MYQTTPTVPSFLDTDGLAARARDDGQGLTELYRRLAPALYAWAALRIQPGLRGRLEPEDVVQETWWRALDTFDRFDSSRGSFRGWLFGIATHVLLNGIRNARRRTWTRPPDLGIRDPEPQDIVDDGTRISKKVARSENTRILVDRLLALPEAERDLLVHMGLEGLTAGQAAELLGISEASAAKRWQRLRERLRTDRPLRDLLG